MEAQQVFARSLPPRGPIHVVRQGVQCPARCTVVRKIEPESRPNLALPNANERCIAAYYQAVLHYQDTPDAANTIRHMRSTHSPITDSADTPQNTHGSSGMPWLMFMPPHEGIICNAKGNTTALPGSCVDNARASQVQHSPSALVG
jgi:hypothetical protein